MAGMGSLCPQVDGRCVNPAGPWWRPPVGHALPMDRLRSCPGWRRVGNKTLAVDQRLLQVHCPRRSHKKKLVAEALKPGNTDTAKNFGFLQIIRTWPITNWKNDPEEESSMFKIDCKACSHSIVICSAITSCISDGMFARSDKAV